MKTSRGSTIRALLAIMAIMLFVPGAALAAGTAAGSDVTNVVDLQYTFGASGVLNTGSAVNFVVDEKIIFTAAKVTDASNLAPGEVDAWVSYTVSNQGNSQVGIVLDFVEDSDNMAGGGFAPAIYIDANADGLYDAGDTAYTAGNFAFNLNADATSPAVFLVGDVPAGALNGQAATYRLKAQASDIGTNTLKTETGGVDDPATQQTVLADADSDGLGADAARDNTYYSDVATFTVTFANVTVTKTILSTVWDPYNFNGGTQKAIPGAYVEYQIVILNAGPGSVVLSTMTDTPGAGSTVSIYANATLVGPGAATSTFGGGTEPAATNNCTTATASVNRACDTAEVVLVAENGGVDTNADGALVTAGGVLTLDMATILEATGGAIPRLAGELLANDDVTLRYMVEVTP